MTNKLTPRQIEALKAASTETDGWLRRGASRIWGIAPGAVYSMVKRGYLEMHRNGAQARLTEKGRALLDAHLVPDHIAGRFEDPHGELVDWTKASV